MPNQLKKELEKKSDKSKAKLYQRFFKTGKGEYGEGDVFIGVVVPELKKIAKEYQHLNFQNLQKLLSSKIHEYRMIALMILVNKFKTADEKTKKKIVDLYLKNSKRVNNWDLVDSSASYIVGAFLFNKSKKEKQILYKFAKSENLWQRRISIISTYYFIRQNEFEDTLRIAEILVNDKHDLIHKAVGWMLRETGKRDLNAEEKFLKKYHKNMPRTMLRYSIEKFEENKRKKYLKGEI